MSGRGLLHTPREATCGFTGHRFGKLPIAREDGAALWRFGLLLKDAAVAAMDAGCRHFISGFAQGSDLLFAQAVQELRESYGEITLEAALAFRRPQAGWRQEEQARFAALLRGCDRVTVLRGRYGRGCYFVRNDYIVNNSARMIAVYNGQGGGTGYTVGRARRAGLPIDFVWPYYRDEENV